MKNNKIFVDRFNSQAHNKEDFLKWIGEKVTKISPKPFKSGSKINTVSGITTNLQTGNLAFTFKEDKSSVEIWRCKKA